MCIHLEKVQNVSKKLESLCYVFLPIRTRTKVSDLVLSLQVDCISFACSSCKIQSVNNGMSLSSLSEHKYSPSRIINIVPKMCTIHQSQVFGKPPYAVHVARWIRKRVTEKSRHFFAFSTMIARRAALQYTQ